MNPYILSALFFLLGLLTGLFFLWLYWRKSQGQLTQAQQTNRDLQVEVQTIKNQHEFMESQRERQDKALEGLFKSIASETLKDSSEQFLQLARQTLAREGESLKGSLSQEKVEIKTLLDPIKKLVEDYRNETLNIEKHRQAHHSQLEVELRKVAESHTELASQTRALTDALKKPHIRGRWGEVQLKNCIDLAGMSEHCDVEFQSSQETEGKLLRPDMIVKMPGGRMVIVDAKTPLDAYLQALEVTDEKEKNALMVRHAAQLKEHIRKLSEKSYSDNYKSADFTVMFLPNESFLYGALESQRDLVEYALDKKILIATPPTFVGLLKVIRYGWQEEKLAQNAEQISLASQELHKRLVLFVETFLSIGKSIDRAKAEFDTGLKRLNSRVLVQARKVESLGARSHKELPEDLGH